MPKREKIQHILVLICVFILCAAFLFSVYQISKLTLSNITVLCSGIFIFYFESKKYKIARYVSGVVFALIGICIIFGYFDPFDGNVPQISPLKTIFVFLGSACFIFASSLCFDISQKRS